MSVLLKGRERKTGNKKESKNEKERGETNKRKKTACLIMIIIQLAVKSSSRLR
jgi:hypothetical protein